MEKLMTSEEVAELLHVDPVTVRRLVNKGELSAYRIGADYRVAPADLQEYLQRQRIAARPKEGESGFPKAGSNPFSLLITKILQGKQMTPTEVVDRFDQFTQLARSALALAQEEAERFGHNYVGTEHLLLGLIREEQGIAAQVLNKLGIELSKVREAVEFIIGRGERVLGGQFGLTPRAKKVIQLAVDEAQRLNQTTVGTEHLLLGLVHEGEGIAAGVLKSLGANLERVRAQTIQTLQTISEQKEVLPSVPAEATTLVAEDEQGLTCPRCQAKSPTYFHYCFNCGHQYIQKESGETEEE